MMTEKKSSADCKCTALFEVYNDTRVRLVSSRDVFQHRVASLHCLVGKAVAHAASSSQQQLPWTTTTDNNGNTQPFRFRVYHGDYEPTHKCPATMWVSQNSKEEGEEKPNNDEEKASTLFFPDFTFESWPEINEYSVQRTSQSVVDYVENTLGTDLESWVSNRTSQAIWRGALKENPKCKGEKIRKEVSDYILSREESERELFDVNGITYRKKEVKGADGRSEVMTKIKDGKGQVLGRQDVCNYRYALHLNGLCNGYSSALKWKLLCGGLVFVQDFPTYGEWWSANLTAYEHYVPFSSPEDLVEKVKHYSTQHEEAHRIAQNGFQIAKLAFENVHDYMVHALQHYHEIYGDNPLDEIIQPEGDMGVEPAMNLEELRAHYGPNVCV